MAESPQDAARRLSMSAIASGYRPEALHEYKNSAGQTLYWRIRCKHPETGEKWIRPMHQNGRGYQLGMPELPAGTLLYGLDHLVDHPTAIVFIVEGEKAADALDKLGILAVTSGGSSSADKADWAPLQDRLCVVWPDNDKSGMDYAAKVLKHIPTARLIHPDVLEPLPEKGDAVDWLAQHPNATVNDVHELATIAPPEEYDGIARVRLIGASTLKPEPIRWLWPGWLARGKLHVLAGSPGTGKTTIAMAWTACVSAGLPFPSDYKPDIGHVLVWSGEDDPRDTLVPRLLAAGANLSRIHFIEGIDEEGRSRPFDPATDVMELSAEAAKLGTVSMLVVDPIVSAIRGDSHKNAEVRRSLAPLVDLAARLDAALLGITHFTKNSGGREPLERVTGSLAFGALARLVFGTCKQQSEDDNQPQRMMLTRAKSNIGPDGGGFSYAFEQTELSKHPGLMASRIVWGEPIDGSARVLLAEPDEDHGDDPASFLQELLAGGPIPAKDVYREADNAGYSRDQMKRAKGKVGVKVCKEGGDFGGKGAKWVWTLSSTRERDQHKGATETDRALVGEPLPCARAGDMEAFDL